MSEPILPIPTADVPDLCGSTTTGDGAQTAFAAMIRKRRMAKTTSTRIRSSPRPNSFPPPEQPGGSDLLQPGGVLSHALTTHVATQWFRGRRVAGSQSRSHTWFRATSAPSTRA